MFVRNSILAGALVLSFATAASAQDVIFNSDEEVVVREYIVKQPRADVVIPDEYDIDDVEVGSVLPDTITVTPLDAPGFEKRFEYVVIGDQTVLVDPETREIVKVLD